MLIMIVIFALIFTACGGVESESSLYIFRNGDEEIRVTKKIQISRERELKHIAVGGEDNIVLHFYFTEDLERRYLDLCVDNECYYSEDSTGEDFEIEEDENQIIIIFPETEMNVSYHQERAIFYIVEGGVLTGLTCN